MAVFWSSHQKVKSWPSHNQRLTFLNCQWVAQHWNKGYFVTGCHKIRAFQILLPYMMAKKHVTFTATASTLKQKDTPAPVTPLCNPWHRVKHILSTPARRVQTYSSITTTTKQSCKGNSQIPLFWLCDSCDTLWFLQLCVIIHLESHTKSQHPLITQYVSHIVYPYHIIPLSISVPCYCH